MNVDPETVKKFVDFCLRPDNIQNVAYGSRLVDVDDGTSFICPQWIRKSHRDKMAHAFRTRGSPVSHWKVTYFPKAFPTQSGLFPTQKCPFPKHFTLHFSKFSHATYTLWYFFTKMLPSLALPEHPQHFPLNILHYPVAVSGIKII